MVGRPNMRRRGALERQIVATLAEATEPLTPAEVRDRLGSELAYTTVLTTLTRLYEKQAVSREPRGRAYAYTLIGSQAESEAKLTAREMRKLMLRATADPASVLSSFVDSLDEDAERILRDLLDRP